MKNTIEQGQSTTPDFKALFNKRLANIPSLASEDRKIDKYLLEEAHGKINGVKRIAYCFVFAVNSINSEASEGMGLLLQDPNKDLDYSFQDGTPHWRLNEELTKIFKNSSSNFTKKASAAILEDNEGKRHLLLENSRRAKYSLKDEALERKHWEKLFETYEISTVVADVGPIAYLIPERYKAISGQVLFINDDALGRKRENDYINSFAIKYNMTNIQWLRFRSLVNSANAAKISTNYDNLAEGICS